MPTTQGPLLSVVVPLFNEESSIKMLLLRLRLLKQQLQPYRLEMVFVDDCSQDQTTDLIKSLCAHEENVRLIRLAKNSGSHAAIMAGIAESAGDCVMFLAGDLQDPPEIIPELLDKWSQGTRIVWAARKQTRSDGMFSSLYWRIVYHLTRLPIPKTGVDFFLIDRKVVEAITPACHSNVPIFQAVAETGFNTDVIYFQKAKRAAGKSGWTLKKKLSLVLETILVSPVAMRLFTGSGAALAILGLLSAGSILLAGFSSAKTVDSAWAVIAALTFFSGLQLMMLGLLGEYLFLALKEARKAPRFVIAEKVQFSTKGRNAEPVVSHGSEIQTISSSRN